MKKIFFSNLEKKMTEVIEDHASKFQRFFIFNSSWGPTEDTGIIIYVSVKILKEISVQRKKLFI